MSLLWNVSCFFLSMMTLQENVCYACGRREKQNVTINCSWLSSHSSSHPLLSHCHILLLLSFGFFLYFPVLLFVFPDLILSSISLHPSLHLSLLPPFLTPSLSPKYPALSLSLPPSLPLLLFPFFLPSLVTLSFLLCTHPV